MKKNKSRSSSKKHFVGSEPGSRGKSVGLRIIGGKCRGTALEYSGDHRVRPMKDRVREAVFNLIGPYVRGRHVIDLFAGTGALAFEAISRGALSATVLEIHFPTAEITRKNIDLLERRMPGCRESIHLITTDVFFWGQKIREQDPGYPHVNPAVLPPEIPWLVFCSPPYDFYVSRKEELLLLLKTLRETAPANSLFVIEADNRFHFEDLQVAISPRKRKSYPPAEVGLFYTGTAAGES